MVAWRQELTISQVGPVPAGPVSAAIGASAAEPIGRFARRPGPLIEAAGVTHQISAVRPRLGVRMLGDGAG